jgi:hypothetical protein
MSTVPQQLHQCRTLELQKAWIKRALLAGQVLSDSGLWLGGVDRPEQMVAALCLDGMEVVTTTVKVLDAADEEHQDVAWRLAD